MKAWGEPWRNDRGVKRLNVFPTDLEYDESDPEGYHAGMNRFGNSIGAVDYWEGE
jgi:hypothetical protein